MRKVFVVILMALVAGLGFGQRKLLNPNFTPRNFDPRKLFPMGQSVWTLHQESKEGTGLSFKFQGYGPSDLKDAEKYKGI